MMTRSLLLVALGVYGAALLTAEQVSTRSVWDGVYTEAQAKRGEALYNEHCVRCHGPELLGAADVASPLTGPAFNGNWNGVPLGQMLDRVRLTMPQDKPETLSRQQSADVLSYIFSVNKFPPGKTELPRTAEMLNMIQYKASPNPKAQSPKPKA